MCYTMCYEMRYTLIMLPATFISSIEEYNYVIQNTYN